MTDLPIPPFSANNAFFYYADLPQVERFYREILGCALVADYGFAKTVRLASSSYLTLVDGTRPGLQHTLDEPKTVTLALITEQVETWYDYLTRQQVTISHPLNYRPNQPHDGFVAHDPEGYFLEFERFNPHPENERLMPRLAALTPIFPSEARSQRPVDLGISATVLWLYYRDLPAIRRFYESALGLQLLVDQGFAQVYQTSPSGLLGPVIAGQGLHPYSAQKAVTVSLITDLLDDWFDRLRARADFPLRTPQIERNARFDAFVGYDPEGYFLEFDHFKDW